MEWKYLCVCFICTMVRGLCGMERGLRVVESTRSVPALQSCSYCTDYSCSITDILPRRGCSAVWSPHSSAHGHGLPLGAVNTKREVQTLICTFPGASTHSDIAWLFAPAPLVQCTSLSQQRSGGSRSGIWHFHSLNKPCGSGHLQAVSSPANNHLLFGSRFHYSS